MKKLNPRNSRTAYAKRLAVGLVAAGTLSYSTHAASITWNGTTTAVWATGTNWSANIAPGAADIAVFNNAGNANTVLDLGASGVTASGLLFETSSAAAYTIGFGGNNVQTLTLSNGGSVTVNSGVVQSELIKAKVMLGTDGSAQTYSIINNAAATSSTLTISGSIIGSTGSGLKTLAVSGGGYTVLSGTISNGTTGTVGIAKSSTGTLVLSGDNTFTGSIALNGGNVIVRGDTGSLAGTVSIIGNGGTFGFDGSGTPTGSHTLSIGALSLNSGESTIYVARAASSNYTLTFSSYSRSAGAVGVFLGTNTMNTFGSGNVTTTIGSNGIYKITGQAAGFIDQGTFLGTGTGANYAWMDSTAGVRAINYSTDAGASTSSGGTSVSGTYVQITGAVTNQATTTLATLNILNANNFTLGSSATVTVNGILKSGTAGTAVVGGGKIQAGNNSELVLRTASAGDILAINSSILANGNNMLTISGPGRVQLGGSNSFTGGVSIDSGVLRIGNANALNSTAPNSVTFSGSANTGVMQVNGFNVTAGGLNSASSDAVVENISSSTAATLTISNSGTNTYAGVLRDGASSAALSVSKSGAGTQILSGSNTYTGATTVSEGELDVNGSLSASSAVTVFGATLGGSGVVAGSVSGTDATINGSGLNLGATTLTGHSTLSGYNKSSSVTIAGGTTSLTGTTQSTSTLAVSVGAALNNNGRVVGNVNVNGGLLKGNGTIQGNLSLVGGTLAPDNSATMTTVTGDFSMDATSRLVAGVAGTTAGVTFDQLKVSGNVVLNGKLDLSTLGGLTLGETITLIDNTGTGTTTGYFSEIVTSGSTYSISTSGSAYTFTADGTMYRLNYATNSENDGQFNDVTLTVVPEPSTWAMIAGGVGLLAAFPRRRKLVD